MRIASADIPQADLLHEVVRTVEAVGAGASTDADMASAIGKVSRQGRYYRRAAEILGFIRNHNNRAILTPSGAAFLQNQAERAPRLAGAVLNSRLIQRVLPFLESNGKQGVSRTQMETFIEQVTQPVGESMIPRRVSTVMRWLEQIEMVKEDKGRYFLRRALPAGISIIQYDKPDEPLFPKKYGLNEYETVAKKAREAKGDIEVLIDEAARERAEESHKMLVDLVATKVRGAGGIPKSNKYVDLAAAMKPAFYLFEMKSTTDQNVHGQIRRAISQLYEYRYLQEVPAAKLVVVIENPPPKEKKWIVDYVVKDRKLLIAWDGDRKTLKFPPEIEKDLSFLA